MKEIEELLKTLKDNLVYSLDNGLRVADQMTPESLLGVLEKNGLSMFEFSNPKYSYSIDDTLEVLYTVTLSNPSGLCLGVSHKAGPYAARDVVFGVSDFIKHCASKAYSVYVQSEAKRIRDTLSEVSLELSWREQKNIECDALRRLALMFSDYKVMRSGVGELLSYRPSEDEILATLLERGGEAFNFGQVSSGALDNFNGDCKAIAMATTSDKKLWIEFTETRGGRIAAEQAIASRVADIANMARTVDSFVKEMRRREELENKAARWECEIDAVFQFRQLLLDYKVKKISDGLMLSYEPTSEELCKELALLGAGVFTFEKLRSTVGIKVADGKKAAMAWMTSKNWLSLDYLGVSEDREVAEKAVMAKAERLLEAARAAEAALNIQPPKQSV